MHFVASFLFLNRGFRREFITEQVKVKLDGSRAHNFIICDCDVRIDQIFILLTQNLKCTHVTSDLLCLCQQ